MPLMFPELAKLFENPRRAKLLKFFVFQPDTRMSASAAGGVVGIPKVTAEREARTLTRLGFLTTKRVKKQFLFSANPYHPWFSALRAFFDAATLPSDRMILSAFKGIPGISVIVATGALAREDRSAIDLLIVAKKSKNPRIVRAVGKVERMAGLPLRYSVMEPQRYAERLEAHDRLLRDVFEFKNRLILGRSA